MEVAYVLIKTVHGKLKIVSSKLESFSEVDELDEVFGQYDIIIKVLTENRGEMKRFLQNKLLILEGIQSTETLMVFN